MTDEMLRGEPLYPLRFQPIYKSAVWGGHRIGRLFGRKECEGPVAESWEIADHEHGESVVINGPLRGTTLRQIVAVNPSGLFGKEMVHHGNGMPDRFPLMFKYLDTQQTLPVQVHSRNTAACEGKTGAWIVVDAAPGSRYYAGFNTTFPREEVALAVEAGSLMEMLHPIPARVGECVLLPPGVVHALGEGVLVAEVQTTSDATLRLIDLNHNDSVGNSRPLPMAQVLQSIRFDAGPVSVQRPVSGIRPSCETLVLCEKFKIERWSSTSQFVWHGDNRCCLWTVLSGAASAIFTAGRRLTPLGLSGRDNDPDAIEPMNRGDSILIPAMTLSVRWVAEGSEPLVLLATSLL